MIFNISKTFLGGMSLKNSVNILRFQLHKCEYIYSSFFSLCVTVFKDHILVFVKQTLAILS